MRNHFLILLLLVGACGDDAAPKATANNNTGGAMASAGTMAAANNNTGGAMASAGTMAAGDGDGDSGGSEEERFHMECFELADDTFTEKPLTEDDGDSGCGDPLTQEAFATYCSTDQAEYAVTYDFDECVQTIIAGGCQIDEWDDWEQLTVTFEDDTRCVWGAAR